MSIFIVIIVMDKYGFIKILSSCIVALILSVSSVLRAQIINEYIFDDFLYSNNDYPTEGDSSRSVFGRNMWQTGISLSASRCWHRNSWADEANQEGTDIEVINSGVRLLFKKDQYQTPASVAMVSGFLGKSGTYMTRIRFKTQGNNPDFHNVFSLISPDEYRFKDTVKRTKYQLDYNLDNQGNALIKTISSVNLSSSHQRNCDCLYKFKDSETKYSDCIGNISGIDILSNVWYILVIRVDSLNKTIKYSIISDDDKFEGSIWGGINKKWGEEIIVGTAYYAPPPYLVQYRLESFEGNDDMAMDIDWFLYVMDSQFDLERLKGIDTTIRSKSFYRYNFLSFEIPTNTELPEGKLHSLAIHGPKKVPVGIFSRWDMELDYLNSFYYMEFKYRYYIDKTHTDWKYTNSTSIKLAPAPQYDFVELFALAKSSYGFTVTQSLKAEVKSSSQFPLNPAPFEITELFPNPSGGLYVIEYEVRERMIMNDPIIQLDVVNLMGKSVFTIFDEARQPGIYTEKFDISKMASGVYYVRIKSGASQDVEMLIKK